MVYNKILGLKSTKSTLPKYLPNKLRKDVAVELARPLTDIINTSLSQGRWPALWKREWVCPVPKIAEPQVLKDVRTRPEHDTISSYQDWGRLGLRF